MAPFDWMAYATRVGVVSTVSTNDIMEWFTLFAWREHSRIRYGKSQEYSDVDFASKLETLPRSRVGTEEPIQMDASITATSDAASIPDFSELGLSDDLSADIPMEFLSDGDDADESSVPVCDLVPKARQTGLNKKLCNTCQSAPKEYRKSDCGPCDSVIGMAFRHVPRQGPQHVEALKQLRRTGGA